MSHVGASVCQRLRACVDSERPDRDVSNAFLRRGGEWLAESEELLVVLRYLRMAGAKDFALCRSVAEFHNLVTAAPQGTDIILCRGRHLSLRGVVKDAFISQALAVIPANAEYLLISTERRPGSPVSLASCWSDNHDDLREALEDLAGQEVAVGLAPDIMADDGENLTSASKGESMGRGKGNVAPAMASDLRSLPAPR